MEGVGRRLGTKNGFLLDIGTHSLSGRERNVLFRNNGNGTFSEVGWVNGADQVEDGRGVAVFDNDQDGRLDLVLRNFYAPAELLRNRGSLRHWVSFDLVGTRSNRDAVGARIRVRSGDQWQTRVVNSGSGYLSASSRRQHFGLGDSAQLDQVEVDWPSGTRSVLRNLAADRLYEITEDSDLSQSAN
jgi:enediyne biosynthesis protein E4